MIGYRPPIFYGHPGKDSEDWLRDMQRYIIASRINVAPGAGQVVKREEAFRLVISCLAGDALNWYNTHVKGKNWNASVAPNARGSLPAIIIAPDIKLGQLLYLFRTAYMTVKHLKQMAIFG